MLFKDLDYGEYFKVPHSIDNWIWMKTQPDDREENNCVIVYSPNNVQCCSIDWFAPNAEVEKVNAQLLIEDSTDIVDFDDLQVGEYFRGENDESDWTWLKIKENQGDIDSGGWFNALVVLGQEDGHNYAYETDYCPPDMKCIRVDRPESFK